MMQSLETYGSFMDEEINRTIRRIKKRAAKIVVHHQTCPCCGAKLVNLYRKDKEWKCRKCWECE